MSGVCTNKNKDGKQRCHNLQKQKKNALKQNKDVQGLPALQPTNLIQTNISVGI